MRPAIRKQTDVHLEQDTYSAMESIDFSDETPLVRQEFADETDINKVLARYGVDGAKRPVIWGRETDYNLGLQDALEAAAEARRAYRNVPREIREQYPTWQDFMHAAERGDIAVTRPSDKPKPEKTDTEGEPKK